MAPGDIKVAELFAGIGGFRYGLEGADRSQDRGSQKDTKTEDEGRQGLESEKGKDIKSKAGQFNEHNNSITDSRKFAIIWANEWDRYACQVYRKNYGKKELHEGDLTAIDARDIPDHEILVGGFPCQSFSIAGKRKGFEDTRGTLFFDIARILDTKRPRMCILENVKGLLSHDDGNTFRTILWILHELGYDVQWQVLDSKNWVPQTRERTIIIGHIRGTPRPEIFPFRESEEVPIESIRPGSPESQYSTAITSNYRKGVHSGGETLIEMPKINVVGNLNGAGWEKRHESCRRVYDTNGISPTIPTKTGGGHMAKIQLENSDIRRLTPLECERLQGFPDGWTTQGIDKKGKEVEISDSQRYKMLGNAVTTNVIYEVGRRLI